MEDNGGGSGGKAINGIDSLFQACDLDGSGYIDMEELSMICSDLTIDQLDDVFQQLDSDGDGKISIAEFTEGFQAMKEKMLQQTRDRHQQKRRLSCLDLKPTQPENLTGVESPTTEECPRGERRKSLFDMIGNLDEGFTVLSCQEQICDLYHQLYESGFNDQLSRFEDVIVAIIRDVRQQMSDKDRLERLYNREKEAHSRHMRQLEDDMEVQTQKVENRVRQSEREKFENEKEEMKSQYESEILDLQANLKRLQQIDVLTKNDTVNDQLKSKYDDIVAENRSLKRQLNDLNTNIALMRSENANFRKQVEEKQSEVEREKCSSIESLRENENLTRQIFQLQEANKKLHDTNDDLHAALELAKSKRPNTFPPRNGMARSVSAGSKSDYVRKYLQDTAVTSPGNGHLSDVSAGSVTPALDSNDSPSLADELQSISLSTLHRSNSSNSRQLLPTQDSCEVDSIPEDIDSGHFTIRDGQDDDYEDDDNLSRSRSSNRLRHNYATVSEMNDSFDGRCHNLLDPIHDELALVNHNNMARSCSGCSNRSSSRMSRQSSDCNSVCGTSRTMMNREVMQQQKPINQDPERVFKIVLAGDAAVGKSSFIMRLCKNKFISSLSSTLGVDFQTKTLEVDGRVIALQLWDTAGQERFRSIAKSYFRRADGVLLLYDVTYERSFLSVRDWLEAIEDGAQKPIPIMLVGNKSDLREEVEGSRTCVKFEDGQKLAKDFQGLFIEASAKDGRNILEAVTELSRMLMTNEDLEVQTIGLKLQDANVKKKSPCCNL